MSDDLYDSFLPKTLVGVAAWILVFAFGVAVSGLIFFAIYQSRVNSLEDRLIQREQQLNKEAEKKIKRLEDQLKESQASPANLRVSASDSELLTRTVSASIARVEGQDAGGKVTKGSGFVVKSTGSESWIITNEHLLTGSVAKNLPVRIRVGRTELDSEVYATDTARDLALVIFKTGGLRAIPFAKTAPEKEAEVWAVGVKPGTAFGISAEKARLAETAAFSLKLSAGMDPVMTGGPVLDKDAKALGVLSKKYSAAGSAAGSSQAAVPIKMACSMVLRCPTVAVSPTPTPGPGRATPGSPAPAPAGARPTPTPQPAVEPSFSAY